MTTEELKKTNHVEPLPYEMSSEKENWEKKAVLLLTGESQVTHRPIFTEDSKYVLVICGRKVKVYARETGELVDELCYHSDQITHLALGERQSMKVYTSSLDGYIGVWDYTDGGLLKTIDFGRPILHFALRPGQGDPSLFIVINGIKTNSSSVVGLSGNVLTNRLIQSSLVQLVDETTPILSLKEKLKEIMFSFDGQYLITYHEQYLYICHIDREDINKYFNKYPITACVCHPTEHCIATGTDIGEIYLWYEYGKGEESVVTKTKLHWHAHAVGDLSFSTDGTYLLSGGEEAVLVLWQLPKETKHFRPRLGAPIVGVACSHGDRTFAVSLANNAIHLVSGLSNEVDRTLVSLYHALLGLNSVKQVKTGLVYNPLTHCLVLNGLPGHLQFFDVKLLKVKNQLEIVPQNYVSRSDDIAIVPTTIDFVAFSSSGLWMATLERWDTKVLSPVCRLKFWFFDTKQQRYILNTTVDPPHQDRVTSLIFRPIPRNEFESVKQTGLEFVHSNSELVITTSLDGKFKVWVSGQDAKIHSQNGQTAWSCYSTSYYHNLPCCGCGFSEDGSLIAINFEKYITLWDPITLELRQVFSSPVPNVCFTSVSFGHCDTSHYIIATSHHHVHVWNLLSCHVEWIVPTSADIMVTDPYSSNVAVFSSFTTSTSSSTHLIVFSPLSSTPVAIFKNISSSPVESAIFLPIQKGNMFTSQLFFMDQKQLLYTVTSPSNLHSYEVHKRIDLTDADESKKLFNELFGDHTLKTAESKPVQPVIPVNHTTDKGLTAPPHVLPPMSIYSKTYLMSLLPGTKAATHISENPSLKQEESEDEMKDLSDDETPRTHMSHLETPIIKTDIDEKRRTNPHVGKYDWLIEFFRTELLN